jgi:non-heme chloroperoxidase
MRIIMKRIRRFSATLVSAVVLLFVAPEAALAEARPNCSSAPIIYEDGYTDRSPHRSCTLRVETDITLNYLDWGGKGELLVFLSGLEDNAHIFDDFAPFFRNSFHVIALTRRGFGASSKPNPCDASNSTCVDPYSLAQLSKDVRDLVAAIGDGRPATLVGHSIAGNELSWFAKQYPELTIRCVYLDAAYSGVDRAVRESLALASFAPTAPPSKDPADPTSDATLTDVRIWTQQIHGGLWSDAMEANLHARYRYRPDGSIDSTDAAKSRDAIAAIVRGSLDFVPNYATVRSPALSIYAVPETIHDLFPYAPANPTPEQADAWETLVTVNFGLIFEQASLFNNSKGRTLFRTSVQLPSVDHYVFIAAPQLVATEMAKFLSRTNFDPNRAKSAGD